MKQTEMLFLSKEREKDHYSPANILKLAALVPPLVIMYVFFIEKKGSLTSLILFSTISFSIFWGGYLLVRRSQKSKLKFTSLNTNFNNLDNYFFVKKTLNSLTWTIKEDSTEFIEAYNPHHDFRTWGDEMISILIVDHKILLNSICNLDRLNQAALTFGKNEENISNFIKAFELITQQEKKNSA